MLSCKDITRLVSESFDRKLSLGERMNLLIHVGMCSTCRMFRRFQIGLHQAIRRGALQLIDCDAESDVELPDSARERIGAAIQSSLETDWSQHDECDSDQS